MMENRIRRFEGVANTLFVPLAARIAISKRFPDYFYDQKAMELEGFLPEDAAKGTSEYTDMASVSRYYNMDKMVVEFTQSHDRCNVVYLGIGLETAYDRLHHRLPNAHWYGVDLEEVIDARKTVFGERENEILIGCDMFNLAWANMVDCTLPTMLVVSGVFQYFHEEEVVSFIKTCRSVFEKAEMIFDATSSSGLKFTNWFIKRTGNADALMYFGIDDSKEFADKCDAVLLEERTFFPDALMILGKRLSLITRISMNVAEKKKQALILHLCLSGGDQRKAVK